LPENRPAAEQPSATGLFLSTRKPAGGRIVTTANVEFPDFAVGFFRKDGPLTAFT
jgi:hypothetical protein